MYCTNCGKEISDTAKFCQFCGAQKEGIEGVKTEAVPAETMVSAQPSVPPMNTQQSVPPMNTQQSVPPMNTQPGVPPMNVPVTPQVNAGATVPAQPQEKPKKKKGRIVVLVVLILVLIGVIAIGGLPAVLFGGYSDPALYEPESYIIVDGMQQDIDYLFELNDLQREQYSGKEVEIVGELKEVNGYTEFLYIGEVDSYIVIDSSMGEIRVETSGLEDVIMYWQPGDTVRVTGKISWILSGAVYLLDFYPSDNVITVENIS